MAEAAHILSRAAPTSYCIVVSPHEQGIP